MAEAAAAPSAVGWDWDWDCGCVCWEALLADIFFLLFHTKSYMYVQYICRLVELFFSSFFGFAKIGSRG